MGDTSDKFVISLSDDVHNLMVNTRELTKTLKDFGSE
jgi:hypothetical protein